MATSWPGASETLADSGAATDLLFVFDGELALDNGVSNYMRTIGDYAMAQGAAVEYLVGKASLDGPNVTALSRTVPIWANGSRSYIPVHTPRQALADYLERADPQAVHVQMPFLSSLAGHVIERLKPETTLVGTFHTPRPHGWLYAANKLNALLTREGLKRFDHLFSVSEAARAAAQEIYGVDSEVLPCPVRIGQPRAASEVGAENSMVITFLGRLVARKGIGTFLDSIALLDPETIRNVQVRVIGDGSERTAAKQQAARHGIQDRVQFWGRVPDTRKQELLAASDIVAYPSNGGEAFGIVLAEAMAAGKPVVLASNIEGYAEALSQDLVALFAPNDPQALADRIQTLLRDPGQRRDLYAAQQETIKRFDIGHSIGPRLLAAYGVTVGRPG